MKKKSACSFQFTQKKIDNYPQIYVQVDTIPIKIPAFFYTAWEISVTLVKA